jgi:hypothetical protein
MNISETLFEITEHCLPHPFTHIDLLRARLRTGIAIAAKRRFRIEIEEVLLRIFERLDVVQPYERETAA